jgi:hypothetical protein
MVCEKEGLFLSQFAIKDGDNDKLFPSTLNLIKLKTFNNNIENSDVSNQFYLKVNPKEV